MCVCVCFNAVKNSFYGGVAYCITKTPFTMSINILLQWVIELTFLFFLNHDSSFDLKIKYLFVV